MPDKVRGLYGILAILIFMGGLIGAAPHAYCEDWPSRPIKIIVPYAPGGAVDFVARLLQEPMGKSLNGNIVVENHSGGAGIPAAEDVVRAKPDGYTLGLFASNYLSNAVLDHLSFNVVDDITPISMVVINTVLILVPESSPIHSLKDLVEAAKAKPGTISYGTPGIGTAMYFAGELLKQRAHINLVHVPYRGAGPELNDLLGGHIPVAIMGIGPAIPFIKAGKLRALAITTDKRSRILPDIPTVAELGYPGYHFGEWFAMFGPKGMPPEVTRRIHDALIKAVESETFRNKLEKIGLEATHSSPSELHQFFKSELQRISDIAKQAKIVHPNN